MYKSVFLFFHMSFDTIAQNYIICVQHLQHKSPRYNMQITGHFAPATSTFIHRMTAHFIHYFTSFIRIKIVVFASLIHHVLPHFIALHRHL